jgi:hypothetical protein
MNTLSNYPPLFGEIFELVDPAWLAALDRVDRWLCCRLRPIALRALWHSAWLRADEMHPAYNLDWEIYSLAVRFGWGPVYPKWVDHRRGIAHRRGIDA